MSLSQHADLSEFFCVFNGKLVREKDLALKRDDAEGWTFGCFDTTRTFNGVPFRLDDHLQRLIETARHLMIKPPFSIEELTHHINMVVEANADKMGEKDWWITTKLCPLGFHPEPWGKANVLVSLNAIPFASRADHVRHGLRAAFSSIRRPSADSYTPCAKANCNYPNMHFADMQVKSGDPSLVSLQMDSQGNVIEGNGANLFIIKKGVVLTPPVHLVLEGISRKTVIELCEKLGFTVQERPLSLYDVYLADEAFITSTSWCIVPIRTIDGRTIGASTAQKPYGPITESVTDAYKQLVGCDFVAQYLNGDGKYYPVPTPGHVVPKSLMPAVSAPSATAVPAAVSSRSKL
jgi:branched-chain amino acid aminotransferase